MAERSHEELMREVEALRQRIAQLETGQMASSPSEPQGVPERHFELVGVLPSEVINEFNNVLTVVLGYTELAQADIPRSSMAWGFLQHVHTAAKRARDLGQLLFISSHQSARENRLT